MARREFVLTLLLLSTAWPTTAAAPKTSGPNGTATERRVHPDRVDASSFLWNSWNTFQENYHPNYVADDDAVTAWVEGVADDGLGERLELRLTDLPDVTAVRLKIRNGYQKSKKLFAANARPKDVRVRVLPAGPEKSLTLGDTWGWQDVRFETPPTAFEGLAFTVVSVYPGTVYKDTCVSDLQVFVTSKAKENPSFEKKKFERLAAWRAQRLAAAKRFKAGPSDSPTLPVYRPVRVNPIPPLDKALAEYSLSLAELRSFQDKYGTWDYEELQTELAASVSEFTEGLQVPERVLLNASWFKLARKPAAAEGEDEGPGLETNESSYYVLRQARPDGGKQVRALVTTYAYERDGRESYSSFEGKALYVYDDRGFLRVFTTFDIQRVEKTYEYGDADDVSEKVVHEEPDPRCENYAVLDWTQVDGRWLITGGATIAGSDQVDAPCREHTKYDSQGVLVAKK